MVGKTDKTACKTPVLMPAAALILLGLSLRRNAPAGPVMFSTPLHWSFPVAPERILASKSQVKQFQRFRGEGTLSKHHILQTLLHLSLLPVKMKVIKSLVVSLFSFLFFFFFLSYWTICSLRNFLRLHVDMLPSVNAALLII